MSTIRQGERKARRKSHTTTEGNILHQLEVQGMAGAWHIQWYTHIGLLTIKGASAARRVVRTNGGKGSE
jgi:hypothetical protein